MAEGWQASSLARTEKQEAMALRASLELSRLLFGSDGSHKRPVSLIQTKLTVIKYTFHETPSSSRSVKDYLGQSISEIEQTGSVSVKYACRKEALIQSANECMQNLAHGRQDAATTSADTSPSCKLGDRLASSNIRAQTNEVDSDSNPTQGAAEASNFQEFHSLKELSGSKGCSPLYGHLLSEVMALVGDQPAEKAELALVCKKWRNALAVHTAWTHLDATHRPISSLCDYTSHLSRLIVGTESLSLAEKEDAPQASQLLSQLAAVSSEATSKRACRCASSLSFSAYDQGEGVQPSQASSESSDPMASSCTDSRSVHSCRGTLAWRLPRLKRLRIYKSLGAGYISFIAPGAIFAAMDSIRRTSDGKSSSRCTDTGGLQYLEELVVECEIGADVLLGLTGKTPRLRSLVISQLRSDEAAIPHAAQTQSPAAFAGQTAEAETAEAKHPEERVTAFEALLLLLQSLPSQQLNVFGLNTAIPRSTSSQTEANELSCSGCKKEGLEEANASLQASLKNIRERLERRRREGFPEEAESDELLSLLATEQNKALCALWTPQVEPSLGALDTLQARSPNLRYCSVPGAFLTAFLKSRQ